MTAHPTPQPPPPPETDAPPLAGVRVLDLTRLLPGPVCSMHLADMGADVIKIEDTGAGDYAAPALRALLHRNKRALRLDLKQPEGVAVLHALARDADVLIESFRPGVTERLGVGYEALARINPKLVYCSITGYGQTGPARDEPGHDLNYCAVTGVTDQVGARGGAPALSNIPMADLIGGSLTSAMGLLAALFDAARTGRGRHVDISMADSMLAHALVPMVTLAVHGQTRPAGTDKLSGGLPCYGVYATRDARHLAVGALERKFWDRFCEVIGRTDLQPLHQPVDPAASEGVRAELAEIIGSQSLAYWQQKFEGTECCVSPVLRLEEALQEPHFLARGLVIAPQEEGGAAQIACPVKMTSYTFAVRRPAPKPGEHNREILAEAGFDSDTVAALERQGVVR